MRKRFMFVSTAMVVAAGSTAFAVVNPYTEDFESSGANWSSGAVFTALNYLPSGGPDNSGYGSISFSFANQQIGAQPLLFRGQSNFNSSGNAFVGNWISSGVTGFSFAVRSNAPAPVDFFARFAPAAGPGAVALAGTAQPDTWTTFTVAIDPGTPFIYEGTTFGTAFADVARVQVGVLVSDALAGNPNNFTFDIDKVSIVPAPGATALLGLGVVGIFRRRR